MILEGSIQLIDAIEDCHLRTDHNQSMTSTLTRAVWNSLVLDNLRIAAVILEEIGD